MIVQLFILLSIFQAISAPILWKAETADGDVVRLDDSTNATTLICLYSPYACNSCFSKFDAAISEIQRSVERIRCIVLIRSNPSMRRLLLHNAKVDFSHCKEFYFDLAEKKSSAKSTSGDSQGGLWVHFGVSYCPSVILLTFKNGKALYQYIPFDQLFGPQFASDGQQAYVSLSSHILSIIHHLREKKPSD